MIGKTAQTESSTLCHKEHRSFTTGSLFILLFWKYLVNVEDRGRLNWQYFTDSILQPKYLTKHILNMLKLVLPFIFLAFLVFLDALEVCGRK